MDTVATEQGLTFAAAERLARVPVPVNHFLTSAHATVALVDGALAATAPNWEFTFWDGVESTFRVNVAEGGKKTAVSLGEFDLGPRPCKADWTLDSDEIAQRFMATDHFPEVAAFRIWNPGQDPRPSDSMEIELTCLADTTYWELSVPMVMDEDGSFMVRGYYLTASGTLAAAMGPASGSVTIGGGSLGTVVRTTYVSPDSAGRFEHVDGPVRFAVVADVSASNALPTPLSRGTLDVVDPSGNTYLLPWDTGATGRDPVELVLDPVAPSIASGEWSLTARPEGLPNPLVRIQAHLCTGAPASAERGEACSLLQPAA